MTYLTKKDFDAYPKVPSIASYAMPGGLITVQEKLDGANCGIQRLADSLIVHSRTRAVAVVAWTGTWLPIVDDIGGFTPLVEYVAERAEGIWKFMYQHQLRHIYGEWMTKHTLDYPDDFWGKMFVYDLVTEGGYVRNPESYDAALRQAGLNVVRGVTQPSETPTVFAQGFIDQLLTERRIEGVVIKDYQRDSRGETDQWGQRYAYKMVLPEFKEDHRSNPMFPAPKDPLTVEERVAAFLPERTIEKVYQKVCDELGGWRGQGFPLLLRGVWKDFVEECLLEALIETNFPTLNTRTLRAEVEKRARNFALGQVAQ